MTDSQPATQAAAGALAWLWIVGGGVLTAALALALACWTVQELRERRRRQGLGPVGAEVPAVLGEVSPPGSPDRPDEPPR